VLYVTLTVSPAVVVFATKNAPALYRTPPVLLIVELAPDPVTKKQPVMFPPAPVMVKVIGAAAQVVTFVGVEPVEVEALKTAVPRTAEPPTV
jgi:hypothetical protein